MLSNPFSRVHPAIATCFLLFLVLCAGGYVYDTARQAGVGEGQEIAAQENAKVDVERGLARCRMKVDTAACVAEANEKVRNAAQEEQSIRWQREAARWAWWSVTLGLMQGVVGVAGLLAVLRSLRHSDEALQEARSANLIARSASENELRAWIEIDFKITSFMSVDGNPLVKGTATLTNLGSTPAVDVSYYVSLAFDDSVAAHVQSLIADYVSGELDWSDEMLFPNIPVVRQAWAEHDGRAPLPGILHVFMVAAYKTVFSSSIRITARAWDVSYPGRDDAAIDFASPPRLANLSIVPSRHTRSIAT